MSTFNSAFTPEAFNKRSQGHLPGYLGIEVLEAGQDRFKLALAVQKHHYAPNGFLHAGAVVSLADTGCGYACAAHLPEGANGFTTIELKSNHLGTTREGTIEANCVAVHLGRNTHVWDATVTHRETGKVIALFRCTQMVLYPKS
jgi:1,4-dihydroxy-2-naphthoyl-CoA hydrolase